MLQTLDDDKRKVYESCIELLLLLCLKYAPL